MRQIMKVFLKDFKRMSTNVVALVIVMGLTIIPALYAWFNILSNWDPYGPNATSQMKIAVFSMDEGVALGSIGANIGDSVVEGLQSNSTIGWVFPATKEETLEGVYSGEYYAALIIPEDFTLDMISFMSGSLEHPQILYYENSKKNAIATKITSKVKTTVQEEVNTSFVSTLAEVLSKSSAVFQSADGENQDLVGVLLDGMTEIDGDLTTYVSILDGFVLITETTGEMINSSQSMLPQMESIIDSGTIAIAGMQGGIMAASNTASASSAMMKVALNSAQSSLAGLAGKMETVNSVTDLMGEKGQDIKKYGDALVTYIDVINGMIDGITPAIPGEGPQPEDKIDTEQLKKDLNQLADDSALTAEKVDGLTKSINNDITAISNELTKLANDFDTKFAPALENSSLKVQQELIQAQILLAGMDDSYIDVAIALENYGSTIDGATVTVTETRDTVAELQSRLQKVMQGLEEITEDPDYQEIAKIFAAEPQAVAEFVASPVVMETVTMYEITNYGSAMAPFYTVLAMWVGALILVALIHVKVHKDPDLTDARPVHEFFGRYLTFYLIGQAQALIIVLGDLYFVQIQCLHPFRFWLAASVISFTFTMIMYALTVAMGNLGEGVAVIVMVIQVAGAGCTFPIEVLPAFYQALYRFLPFVYSMDVLKACVGGIYGMEYWYNLGVLLAFAVIFILVGIFLRKPFEGLNHMIEESKKKSGVML